MRGVAALGAAALLVGIVAGCAPQAAPGDGPAVSGPATTDGPTVESACEVSYPSPLGGTDISEATIIPEDWPATPPGSSLCSAAMTSDESAVLQYVTTLTPEEVLAYYEPLLQQYTPVISDGVGDYPILNGVDGDFEFAIQTGEAGTFLVAAAIVR